MVMAEFLLSSLIDKNRIVEITGFEGSAEMVERLQELGLRIGLEVHYFGQSPFSGPLLYRLDSTVMALRQEEAQCILIRNKIKN